VGRCQLFLVMVLSTAVSFGQAPDATSTSPLASAAPPSTSQSNSTYGIQVESDEVSVIFHATDKAGKPVHDLKPSDLDLFDNERGPGQIVRLQLLEGRPIRVGFLIDTSGSVSEGVRSSRATAVIAAQALMQGSRDRGLSIGFGRTQEIAQPWSADVNAVTAGIGRIGSKPEASLDGTSLFDTIWSTCSYQFRGQQNDTQNVILLFTDGLDVSSHGTLEQAAEACQRNHVTIFAFATPSSLSDLSTGQRSLRELTEMTGGGLLEHGGTDAEIRLGVEALAAEIRSEYLLSYRPANLKHDGKFHRITLVGPQKVANIVAQSGYYALAR
jgi:Ca-activated chloride channel homolog